MAGEAVFGPRIHQNMSQQRTIVQNTDKYNSDADFICNVMGGEAVSLNINYTHSEQFAAAGYEKFMVDGEEFGEVRQYGNCKSNRSI